MVSCSTEKNLSTNLRKPRISSFHQYDGLKRANATEIENHNIVSNEHYSSEIKIANNQSIEASNEIASLNDMKTVDAEPLSEDESFENRPSILQNQLFQNKLDESSNYKNDKVQSNSVKKKVDNETEKKPVNGYAVASLVLSILSLFLSYWGWLICFSFNILFDYLAKKQMKENPEKYRGAKLLKWSSWIFLVSAILWLIIILVML
jgi:hypothetical protein